MSKKNPLMKDGIWIARLLRVRKVAEEKVMDQYLVGIFKSAQEAFLAGNDYAMNNIEAFKTNSDGVIPERLAIELIEKGKPYPECLKHQEVFYYLPSQSGPYMDLCGVTRPTFMLKRGLATIVE